MTTELNAVITGASSGIGRAVAVAIAETQGCVCLVGRNVARLEETARVVRSTARAVSVFAPDLTLDERSLAWQDILSFCPSRSTPW
jgi:short-subunit dehydrogenase